jgi:preprotein translocase subunit SecB
MCAFAQPGATLRLPEDRAMTTMTPPPNGGPRPTAGPPLQVRFVAQYIKDLSFESPNVDKLVGKPAPDNVQVDLQVNVNGKPLGGDLHESVLHIKAKATANVGVVYELEVAYGAVLKVENAPAQAMEALMLIHAPAYSFPYVRRLISDITREGGFPLNLEPIDFASLYMRRQQEAAAAQTTKPS